MNDPDSLLSKLSSEDEDNQITRRDFMTLAASSMAFVGVICVGYTLVNSMNPSKDVLALSSVEVDLTNIALGTTATVKWQGKPVFITHRTTKDIAQARSISLDKLIDPESDEQRVQKGREEWLITIGICTHLGCVPLPNKGEFGGWLCPCHGSHYDISGRIRKGPAPANLKIPPYNFISDTLIKIG